ncbi:hypothetical protein [Oryzibacter oryziterrae]|uniref:hypothetical protein n=1 Tax=Oryzibacter oryziterrae TaxID=2766474 RepID=UPI001F48799E|nr:hypothetical protein [Oryzibacter oryziterrae]
MSGLAPGTLAITVGVAGGVVASVDIRSDRPLSLASRLVGRPVGDAVAAVGLLHAVCGQSHAAALHFAAEAALGRTLPTDEQRQWSVRLAAERIGEHLRELLIEQADEAALPLGREAIALAHALARGGADARQLEALRDQTEALWPALGRKIARDTASAGAAPPARDPLTAVDDLVILAGLSASEGFLAHPSLPGRCPEVGPAARLMGTAAMPGATRAARLAEMEAALTEIGLNALAPHTIAVGPGQGFAAVESPRGRLCYLVEVNADGRLVGARVLAPTEWNFHPSGPFAKSLVGRRPANDAHTALARLAADFCPCVAVAITVTDLDHA